ncbi:hypothetical protein PTI98_007311 [Pleurotus ostreatus]|nr:hypothetical protein PTI98_007311 [Pleurotus ostreatus]
MLRSSTAQFLTNQSKTGTHLIYIYTSAYLCVDERNIRARYQIIESNAIYLITLAMINIRTRTRH